MVEQHQHQPAVLALVAGHDHAQQRRLAHVQAQLARVVARAQLLRAIPRQRVQLDLLHLQRRLAPDHLHRLGQALPVDRRAQHVVARDHLPQRGQEGVETRARVDAEQRVEQIGVALAGQQMVEQHALLQRRERIDVLHVGDAARHPGHDPVDLVLRQRHQRQQRRRDPIAADGDQVGRHLQRHRLVLAGGAGLDRRGQRGQGGRLEQQAHVGRQARLAGPFDGADRQQRMAAQFEEVVVAAHPGLAQHVLPDLREGAFHGALRRGEFAARVGLAARLGQGLAVELAVGRQRPFGQAHEGARHHVLGQRHRQLRAQRLGGLRAAGVVAHQAALAAGRAVLARQRQRVAHALAGGQRRADLAQLDAEAPDLDLLVVAAQVLDRAVQAVARQVAGAIQAAARRAERIGHEALGAQRGPVQVAARQAHAGDVQLARHAHRHRFAGGIEQVDTRVGDRQADWHTDRHTDPHAVGRARRCRGLPGRLASPGGHVDGGLGRAIQVVQAGGRQAGLRAARQRARQGLAAADHAREAGAARRRLALQEAHEGLQHRGHEVHRADALALDQRGQVVGLLVAAGAAHHQAGAHRQRPEELPDRHVEAERRLLQHAFARHQAVGGLHPVQAVGDAAVRHRHALGLAGRARGVDHVG